MENKHSIKMEETQHKALLTELREGLRMAEQLRGNLNLSTSPLLLTNLLSTFDKAIELLIYRPPPENLSYKNRNLSEGTLDTYRLNFPKKRKVAPRWTDHVKIYSKSCESSMQDGFSWRKYGQKDILGSTFPRGYYRCSHRNTHGCMATKQVQRTDKDPSIVENTYRGNHTCSEENKPVTSKTGVVKQSVSLCKNNSEMKKHIWKDELGKVPELFTEFNYFPRPSSSEEEEEEKVFGRCLVQAQGAESEETSSSPRSVTNYPVWYVMQDVPPLDIDTSFSIDVVDLFT